MGLRMTDDEIQMIKSVIRTSSNTDNVLVRHSTRSMWDSTRLSISIKNQHTGKYIELVLDDWVPDVPPGEEAAAMMVEFMFDNEECPKCVATFFDYIQMAYEFGKNHRWT